MQSCVNIFRPKSLDSVYSLWLKYLFSFLPVINYSMRLGFYTSHASLHVFVVLLVYITHPYFRTNYYSTTKQPQSLRIGYSLVTYHHAEFVFCGTAFEVTHSALCMLPIEKPILRKLLTTLLPNYLGRALQQLLLCIQFCIPNWWLHSYVTRKVLWPGRRCCSIC